MLTTAKTRRALRSDHKPEAPPAVVQTAAFFYTENKHANRHAAAAKKFRAKCLGHMKDAGLKLLNFSAMVGGILVPHKKNPDEMVMEGGTLQTLKVEVAAPKARVVNIEKLSKKVDMATLLKIVSATQKAVLEHVPNSVLEQCLDEVTGEENVNVEVA